MCVKIDTWASFFFQFVYNEMAMVTCILVAFFSNYHDLYGSNLSIVTFYFILQLNFFHSWYATGVYLEFYITLVRDKKMMHRAEYKHLYNINVNSWEYFCSIIFRINLYFFLSLFLAYSFTSQDLF
ncbi:hypothetical protein BDC45DRAFT_532674 [Circinella umbellata]|nr:hypothetical protein BDC45DRAFT_532674 [Circinella umbellata]